MEQVNNKEFDISYNKYHIYELNDTDTVNYIILDKELEYYQVENGYMYLTNVIRIEFNKVYKDGNLTTSFRKMIIDVNITIPIVIALNKSLFKRLEIDLNDIVNKNNNQTNN